MTLQPLALLALLTVSSACVAPAASAPVDAPINARCPRSGKPVATDSLTTYRGRVVGFCNPHCRDDFAAQPESCPDDRAFFDRILDAN
jgi:YHS domain-containing protein